MFYANKLPFYFSSEIWNRALEIEGRKINGLEQYEYDNDYAHALIVHARASYDSETGIDACILEYTNERGEELSHDDACNIINYDAIKQSTVDAARKIASDEFTKWASTIPHIDKIANMLAVVEQVSRGLNEIEDKIIPVRYHDELYSALEYISKNHWRCVNAANDFEKCGKWFSAMHVLGDIVEERETFLSDYTFFAALNAVKPYVNN